MPVDLLTLKETGFVLWRPGRTAPAPVLVIGTYQAATTTAPAALANAQTLALSQQGDLWLRPAGQCGLVEGQVYHYFFEVTESNPWQAGVVRRRCTDPTAMVVDWRLEFPPGLGPDDRQDRYPAAVVKFSDGKLIPSDPDGRAVDWTGDADLDRLPPNNRLVIYELPTRWTRRDEQGREADGVGTFRDARRLIDGTTMGGNFAPPPRHLIDLGVNGLELLPPADSFQGRLWGYATSHYFAADFDLGRPAGQDPPTASNDLVALVKACHNAGVRFILDAVMAFSNGDAYKNVNFADFHVQWGSSDPELEGREDAFGGDYFKYNYFTSLTDPLTGNIGTFCPARQLMKAHVAHWINHYRVDGLRLDSIKNVKNWDFVQEVTTLARDLWRRRWPNRPADDRFLTVGEELAVPMDLLTGGRLEGLWNEHFKRAIRQAVLGRAYGDPSFEWTVRRMIDCRQWGFRHVHEAVNYIGSHDVGGMGNERFYDWLQNNGVADKLPRFRLAFACLLTAVGIPMIFAGDEFADQHDKATDDMQKQEDPVNFDRRHAPWRKELLRYVARLVKFRTTAGALSVNETEFIHVDFNDGKRVLAWRRGRLNVDDPVVVVANFSDWGTDTNVPNAEYRVPNWPGKAAGRRWREVGQDRDVPDAWIGREPVYPWEAKVYAAV